VRGDYGKLISRGRQGNWIMGGEVKKKKGKRNSNTAH